MIGADLDIDAVIGLRIRDLRCGQDLTLEALAQRAGVSRAMLSRIERGDSSPTAQLLNKVCGGLGISLSTLLTGADQHPSPLSRRKNQLTWRDPASHYVRRSISPPASGSAVDVVEIAFPAQACVGFDNEHVAAVDQHIWVLEGELEITMGDDCYRLEEGDCLLTRFGRPIRFRNPTSQVTRYAVIINKGRA